MPDALDLGDAMRASATAAGLDLNSDVPLVTGPAPASVAADDNPFERLLETAAKGEPSPAPDPTPAPTPTAEPTAEDTPRTDVLTRLKERFNVDLTTKYKDDDDLLQAHVNLTKKLAERDELAQLGRVAATDPNKLLEFYRSRGIIPEPQPQQPPPKEPPATAISAEVPEWDDDWNQYIERGRLVAETPPAVAKSINEYYRAKTIAKSPQYQAMQRKLAEIEQKITQQPQQPQGMDPQVAEYIQFQQAEKLIERNAGWLFKDKQSAKSGLSPDGFVWVQSLNESHQKGLPVDVALRLADQEVQIRKLSSAAPTPTPNKQAAQRQADPARPAQPQELLSGDIIRPGEDIAIAARRLAKQLGEPWAQNL